MSNIQDLSDTIIPKSDQLNADDLVTGDRIISITGVSRGNSEHPIIIHYEGDNGRPYKPCKTMRKILLAGYGADGSLWAGKQLQLYCDPSVKWAGVEVGGIRIRAMSDLPNTLKANLMVSRGKKKEYVITVLQVQQKPAYPSDKFQAAFNSIKEYVLSGKMTHEQAINKCEQSGTLTDEMKAQIRAIEDEPVTQGDELFDE